MPIFDNDILNSALAIFDISKIVADLDNKKQIIQSWISALEKGNVKKCYSTKFEISVR